MQRICFCKTILYLGLIVSTFSSSHHSTGLPLIASHRVIPLNPSNIACVSYAPVDGEGAMTELRTEVIFSTLFNRSIVYTTITNKAALKNKRTKRKDTFGRKAKVQFYETKLTVDFIFSYLNLIYIPEPEDKWLFSF